MALLRTVAPAAKCLQKLGLCRGRHILDLQRAGEPDHLPKLHEVRRAAVAPRDVPLEARDVAGRQRALEIVGNELDQLAAAQDLGVDAHSSRYSSSARRTF